MPLASDVVGEAVERAQAALTTNQSDRFEKAVHRFAELLSIVPDFPPSKFSREAIGLLTELADQVIDRIEARLGNTTESASVQRRLVDAIYEIRRAIEQVEGWYQYYERG